MPSRRRFSIASSLWMNRWSENWSVTMRLISSGIVRSKLRSPDSTCASGMPSLTATSAAAIVEFTSPGTITQVGRLMLQQRLEALHHAGGLDGMAAGAHAQV